MLVFIVDATVLPTSGFSSWTQTVFCPAVLLDLVMVRHWHELSMLRGSGTMLHILPLPSLECTWFWPIKNFMQHLINDILPFKNIFI